MTRLATVVVADDHPASCLGVGMALRAGGFDVVAEVHDGPSAVSAALRALPDVCLLDVRMPGGGGIEAAAEIVALLPDTLVVMLTVSDTEEDVFNALRAGAVGYLLKDIASDRLPAVLCGVLKGEAALPREMMGRVVAEFRRLARTPGGGQRSGPAGMSRREWEILLLLRADMTTTEIAGRLSVSPVTVRRHISSAMSKLGVDTRGAAVRMAEELARGGDRGRGESDQPVADAVDGRLHATVDAELLDDVGDVLLDRVWADEQDPADRVVAAAVGDQAENL